MVSTKKKSNDKNSLDIVIRNGMVNRDRAIMHIANDTSQKIDLPKEGLVHLKELLSLDVESFGKELKVITEYCSKKNYWETAVSQNSTLAKIFGHNSSMSCGNNEIIFANATPAFILNLGELCKEVYRIKSNEGKLNIEDTFVEQKEVGGVKR